MEAVEEKYDEAQETADANPGVQYFANKVVEMKGYLDAAKAKLEEVKAELAAECEAAYPPENLTQADQRWVQVPAPLEKLEEEK